MMHASEVLQVAFNKSGNLLISLGSQNDIKIWDVTRGTLLGELVYEADDQVNCIAFGPAGKDEIALVAGLESGKLLFIDGQWMPGSTAEVQRGHPIKQLAITGDEQSIVAVGLYHASVYDATSGTAFSIDLFWHEGSHLCLRETTGGDPLDAGKRVRNSRLALLNLAVSENSSLIALGCGDISLRPNPAAVATESSERLARIGTVRLDPGGKLGRYGAGNPPFLLSGDRKDWREYWKLVDPYSSPFLMGKFEHPHHRFEPWGETDPDGLRSIFGIDISRDNELLATADDDGTLRIWSTDNEMSLADGGPAGNNLVARHSFDWPLAGIRFSHDSSYVAVAEARGREMRIVILETPMSRIVPTIRIESDGDLGGTGFLTATTVPTLSVRDSFALGGDSDYAGAQTKAVLSWSSDQTSVFVWSWRTAELWQHHIGTKSTNRLARSISSFAHCATTDMIAYGDASGTVHLKFADTGQIQQLLRTDVPGSVLMPPEANFPPKWVFTPQGALTLNDAVSGKPIFEDLRHNSCLTYLSGNEVFVFLGTGEIVRLTQGEDAWKRQDLQSPIGGWGSDIPLNANSAQDYDFARFYYPNLIPIKGSSHRSRLERLEGWSATRLRLGPYVSCAHSQSLDRILCAGGNARAVFIVNLRDGRSIKVCKLPNGTVCRLDTCDGGRVGVAWWQEDSLPPLSTHEMRGDQIPKKALTRIVAFDIESGKQLSAWSVPGLCCSLASAKLSPTIAGVWGSQVRVFRVKDGLEVLCETAVANVRMQVLLDPWESLERWEDDQYQRWLLPSVALSPQGESVYLFDETNVFLQRKLGENHWKGTDSSVLTQSLRRPAWQQGNHLISPSGRYLALSGSGRNLRLIDTWEGNARPLPGHLGFAYPSCFSADESMLITSGGDKVLRAWKTESRQPLLDFRMFANGDWVARAPDGRWDGTRAGMERASLVNGTFVAHPLGANELWSSGLVSAILSGTDDPSQAYGGQHLTPLVRLHSDAVTSESTIDLSIELTGRGLSTTGILVFVNGKLTKDVPDVVVGPKQSASLTISGVPLRGQDNRIQVVAGTNSRFPSQVAEVVVRREGAPKPVLHALTIGVNGNELRFAETDAKSISEALYLQMGELFRDVRRYELYGDSSTKSSIERILTKIIRDAEPEDAFAFYFAGHGDSYEVAGDNGHGRCEGRRSACLMPYDALGSSPNSTRCISINDLKRWMVACRAQRQLWILDACGSGTASMGLGDLAFDEDLKRLAIGVGCHILAATEPVGSEKVWEHRDSTGGVLTMCILDELASHSGQCVSLSDLGAAVKRRVRIASKGTQTPLVLLPAQADEFLIQGVRLSQP